MHRCNLFSSFSRTFTLNHYPLPKHVIVESWRGHVIAKIAVSTRKPGAPSAAPWHPPQPWVRHVRIHRIKPRTRKAAAPAPPTPQPGRVENHPAAAASSERIEVGAAVPEGIIIEGVGMMRELPRLPRRPDSKRIPRVQMWRLLLRLLFLFQERLQELLVNLAGRLLLPLHLPLLFIPADDALLHRVTYGKGRGGRIEAASRAEAFFLESRRLDLNRART